MKLSIDFNNDRDKRQLWTVLKSRKGRHVVEVKRVRKVRSLSQNAYYWGVCLPYAADAINAEWGESFDADQAHAFFGDKYLKRQIVNRNTGEVMGEIILSTASLTTEQFSDYIEKIRQDCAEYLGVEIPLPNEAVAV